MQSRFTLVCVFQEPNRHQRPHLRLFPSPLLRRRQHTHKIKLYPKPNLTTMSCLGKGTHCQGTVLGSGRSRKQARTWPFLFFCGLKSSSREKVDWEPVCAGFCRVVALESSSSCNANQLDNRLEACIFGSKYPQYIET